MPNRKKLNAARTTATYSDLLWCTVPLIGMSWYYYGARPVLLLLAALLTAYLCDCAWPRCTARATSPMSRPVSALPRSSRC